MDELLNLLTARTTAAPSTRIQQQVHPAVEQEKWAPVERAMSLLPPNVQDTMPNVRVEQSNIPFNYHRYSPIQKAYISRSSRHPSITLIDNEGTPYTRAKDREPNSDKLLAALLTHEKNHVDHEAGEGPAYNTEIETLRQLRAPQKDIKSVELSRDIVLSGKR